VDKGAMESLIRSEFERALAALEQASIEEKPQATARLNRAVGMLFDLIGYGKLPLNWRGARPEG
jgi:hypothetical protein